MRWKIFQIQSKTLWQPYPLIHLYTNTVRVACVDKAQTLKSNNLADSRWLWTTSRFTFGAYRSPTYHSRSVPTILTKNSHPSFLSNIPIYHSPSLNYKYKVQIHWNSSRKTHCIMKWRFASFKFSSPPSHSHFSL